MPIKKLKAILKKTIPLSLALMITFNSTLFVGVVQYYFYKKNINDLLVYREKYANSPEALSERLSAIVLPEEGVDTGIKWGDLGKRLIEIGVIDESKYKQLFRSPSGNSEYEKIMKGTYDGNIVLTEANSRFVLNTLWALGLAQQSDVLSGMLAEYDQVPNLASTGGWSLGKTDAMDYYGKHHLMELNEEQNSMVKKIASTVYRPCCGNHTAFADCNHGMAMLGLIELMVVNGKSEEEIYDVALKVNSYWFPDQYLTIAKFTEEIEGKSWDEVDAKSILDATYSSAQGFQGIARQVQPLPANGSGGGCGV